MIRYLMIDVTDAFYLRIVGNRERRLPAEPLSRRQRVNQGARSRAPATHVEHNVAHSVEHHPA